MKKSFVLILLLFMLVVACKNPLGGSDGSNVDSNYQPGLPSDDDSGTVSASTSRMSVAPRTIANDGSTTTTVTVTVKDASNNLLSGKVVTLTSSRGATDTIAPASATTNVSGVATFTVLSSTLGTPSLTATADGVPISQTQVIQFFPLTPAADLGAWHAESDSQGVNDPSGTTTWQNASTENANYDGTLTNFSLSTAASTSRWGGDGTTAITGASDGPYRLIFDGNNDHVNIGTYFNANTSASFNMWARPSSSSSRGRILLTNGDSSGAGWTLRQSWDGQSDLTLHMGDKSYAEEILDLSPTGYWRLGESSGASTAYNSTSTAALDGAPNAGVSFGSGGALTNDSQTSATFTRASTGQITVTDNALLDNTNQFTVAAWVQLTTNCNSTLCALVGKRINTNDNESYIVYFSNRQPIFRVGTNAGQQITGSAVAANTWHFIVAVFDGTLDDSSAANRRKKLYVNGALSVSGVDSVTSIPNNNGNFVIGALPGNATAYFDGRIDEVAFYRKALSAAEVAALYAARTRQAVHSTSALTNNAWNFIAGSFDVGTGALGLTLNGNNYSKTTSGATLTGGSTALTVGADGSGANAWAGALGEIQIYSSALSTGNFTTIRSTTSARYP